MTHLSIIEVESDLFRLNPFHSFKKGAFTLERQTLTVKEVANYLGVHTDTAKFKQIPHVKIRNRILFTKESIDLWIQEQEYTNLR